jgi:hypothetical protein
VAAAQDIEIIRLRSAITNNRKLKSNLQNSSAKGDETTRAATSFDNLQRQQFGASSALKLMYQTENAY